MSATIRTQVELDAAIDEEEKIMSHYIPIYAPYLGMRERAVCGSYVDPREHATDPTCQACQEILKSEDDETLALDQKLDATLARARERLFPDRPEK